MPTLREFVERVKALSHEITEGTETDPATGGTIRYLRRGQGPLAILPDIPDTEPLCPAGLSSLCRVLEIPPDTFGLDLGFLHDPWGAWDWD